MPIYTYKCDDHGEFDDIKKVSERGYSDCPKCGEVCENIIKVNEFMGRGYVAPPPAKRHFGENRKRPPNRAKWV